jgi:hypothetical protein
MLGDVRPVLQGRRRWVFGFLAVVLHGFVAANVSAAIALVQHISKDAGTTQSSTLAFPATNTTGNWLAVVIRAGQPGQNITVSDTRGNVYRRALQASQVLDPITVGLYYAENVSGGANTVTVSDSISGGTLRFSIFEYSGVATASSLDGTPASVAAQRRLPGLNTHVTAFAGAYHGWGFHEDGCRSGAAAARSLGGTW